MSLFGQLQADVVYASNVVYILIITESLSTQAILIFPLKAEEAIICSRHGIC